MAAPHPVAVAVAAVAAAAANVGIEDEAPKRAVPNKQINKTSIFRLARARPHPAARIPFFFPSSSLGNHFYFVQVITDHTIDCAHYSGMARRIKKALSSKKQLKGTIGGKEKKENSQPSLRLRLSRIVCLRATICATLIS